MCIRAHRLNVYPKHCSLPHHWRLPRSEVLAPAGVPLGRNFCTAQQVQVQTFWPKVKKRSGFRSLENATLGLSGWS